MFVKQRGLKINPKLIDKLDKAGLHGQRDLDSCMPIDTVSSHDEVIRAVTGILGMSAAAQFLKIRAEGHNLDKTARQIVVAGLADYRKVIGRPKK